MRRKSYGNPVVTGPGKNFPVWKTADSSYTLASIVEGVETTYDLFQYVSGSGATFFIISQFKNGVVGSYGVTVNASTGVLTVPSSLTADTYSTVISLNGGSTRTFGFTVASAATFDYYISTTGSDSNPGTLASPWAITALWTKATTYKGTRVGLLDSTYTPASGFSYGSGESVAAYIPPTALGTVGAKTVIQSVNARGAVINANGLNIGVYIGAAYVTVDGLTVRTANSKGIYTTSDNSLIQNCEVYDIQRAVNDNVIGIRTDGGATNLTIRNNKVHLIRNSSQTNNEACIQIYNAPGCVIEQNTCYDAAAGIYLKDNAQNAVVRYNHVYDVRNSLPATDNNAFVFSAYGNVFEGFTESVFNSIVRDESVGTAFYNNTVVATKAAARAWLFRNDSLAAASYYNNILVRSGGTMTEERDMNAVSVGSFAVCDYNLYGSTARFTVPRYTAEKTLSQWQAATGKDANSQQADPTFVGGTGPAKYKLASGSNGLLDGFTGGTSAGSPVNVGAYASAGQTEQIGADW